MFFRGDPSGVGAHDDLARKMGAAGRKWSQDFWRKEDLVAYMMRCLVPFISFFGSSNINLGCLCRLFMEYSRVMSLDREAMTYRKRENVW